MIKAVMPKINRLALILILTVFSLIFLYLAKLDLFLSLGFVILIAVALIFYQKPEIGIYLIIFSILGGQLIKLEIGNGDNSLLISDIIIPFFLMIWLLRVVIKKEKIPSSLIGPFLFVFMFIAAISTINGLRFWETKESLVSFFYLIRLESYASLFFASATIFSLNNKSIQKYTIILILTFILLALAGIFQLIYFPDLTQWAIKYGWDPHIGRLFSTFLDPNFAGAFLTIGFIISLSLLFYAKSAEGKIILSLSTLLNLIAVILTYSRSSYLFLLISFFVLCLLRSKKLLFIGITAAIILTLIFPKSLERIEGGFSIDDSAKHRFESWEKTLTIVRDYPLLGVGYNAFSAAQESYAFIKLEERDNRSNTGSDSSLLTILATTGVLGAAAYILFYLASLIKTKRIFIFNSSLQQKGMALALFSIMIGLLFHSIFVNSLLYPAIMIPLFITLGITSIDSV